MEKGKKLTKIEMFEIIKTHLTDTDEIEFINRQIDLLKSKNSNKKPTTAQKENETFKDVIVDFLAQNEGVKFNILEIQAKVPEVEKLSNQRMSAILKQLVDGGMVQKEYEKRKPCFFV